MEIIDFKYKCVVAKLKSPYDLSYKKLTEYESIISEITFENGETVFGEVTPLVGYTEETVESIISDMDSLKERIINQDSRNVIDELVKLNDKNKVFTLSGILPPIEYYTSLDVNESLSIDKKDLIYAFDCIDKNQEEIQESIDNILSEGYDTVKIKVGKDIEKELSMIDSLAKVDLKSLKIRFDANCGYTYDDSCLFLDKVSYSIYNNVQYLEQPMCRKCWKEMSLLNDHGFLIPIMIDESIYCIDDIQKAYDIGAKYIKLKLCKFGSITKLQEALDFAKSLGLLVIFGNGVATDISNFYELKFYLKNKSKIFGAVESVGFLKIINNLKFSINVN